MKYATWIIASDGTSPQEAIAAKGGQSEGVFSIPFNTILGYVSDDADLTGLEKWSVTPQTSAQALAIAKSYAPDAYYSSSGTFITPQQYVQIV